eukprot:753615-Prymnesium_polylepis.1
MEEASYASSGRHTGFTEHEPDADPCVFGSLSRSFGFRHGIRARARRDTPGALVTGDLRGRSYEAWPPFWLRE